MSVGQSMACLQVVWEKYIEAMKLAGFDQDQGLYIASGLLTYGASAGGVASQTKNMPDYP